MLLLYIRFTIRLDWSRAYSQYNIACEVDTITQHLQQILGVTIEFVCLVSKPLVHVMFQNFANSVSSFADGIKYV